MNQFKRAKVVMLPTIQKPVKGTLLFRNAFGDKSLWQYKETYTYTCGTEVYRTLGGSFEDWSVGMKPHHLYFTSNDKIEDNDWVIDKYNQIWQYLKGSLIGHDIHGIKRFSTDNMEGHECKKIISSTDLSLKLPSPSEEFIQRYVESYKKEIITDVLVEYETIVTGQCDCMCHKPGLVVMHVMACCHPKHKEVVKVDLKNNTISTKKLKNSWNREEVLFLISKYHIAICVDKTHVNPGDITKWFEENL